MGAVTRGGARGRQAHRPGGDELNWICDIKCDIKHRFRDIKHRFPDIMTAEKKSGLLPRLVGGAKQRAEGMVSRTLESPPATAVAAKTRELVHNLVAGVLTTALVLSLSIFLYATFYHAYMPVEVHEEHLQLQFIPCDTKPALCSFPNATLPLKMSLMSGQAYSMALLLEVPDSPINQGLGMFLSCLSVLGAEGEAARTCRSSILEYRSELLRTLTVILLISWVKFTTTGPHKPEPEPARPERKVSESSEEEVTILEKPDAKDAVDNIETVSSWK